MVDQHVTLADHPEHVGDVAVLAAAPAPTQPATTGTTSATVDTTTVTDELWAADTITKRTWIRSLFNGWSTTTTSRSVTCRAGTKQHANDIIELKKKMHRLYAERTGTSVEKFQELMERDRWIDPKEATELNLISKVIKTRKELESLLK